MIYFISQLNDLEHRWITFPYFPNAYNKISKYTKIREITQLNSVKNIIIAMQGVAKIRFAKLPCKCHPLKSIIGLTAIYQKKH